MYNVVKVSSDFSREPVAFNMTLKQAQAWIANKVAEDRAARLPVDRDYHYEVEDA